ncbi:cation-transporting P-type ATPase [Nodosilinea sp. LEGE 07298]|uniref:cation-translocating P-type ATPase n=1 Tax=Nodosilinea sp. LEGE 07298 TaxID=2777970 RepID=UPI00188267CE|nr:cation-transporting P-type ATPase [Nodosilinea sp. LEGE 07298]MBE9111842.1 cation-transporting P-type ATPase [Nodosilinea sp. LEGE 07298]
MNSPVSPAEVVQSQPQEVLEAFGVDAAQGLNSRQVDRQREKYGWNRLEEAKQRGAGAIFVDQFKSPIIGLLAVAAVLAFAFQEWIEGIAVVIAIALNAVIGFTTELRAVKSMESLQQLSQTQAKVRREGQVQQVGADELVPGDIVVLEGGDMVPADLRLITASNLQADESALTGESLPASKTTQPVEPDLPLAEQTNRVFKGTAIRLGSAEGIVTATGMETELGHISTLASQAGSEQTPLEQRLDQLGRRLIWITLVVAAIVAISGIVQGKDLMLMVETAIALSVAAVPEGLPIVATVALARGMWRMAKQNALINRLSAVETLGSTSIICTDKTGTLTQNRMTASQIVVEAGSVQVGNSGDTPFSLDDQPIDPQQHEALEQLLRVAVLCNNAEPPNAEDPDRTIGDPMEIALLNLGQQANLGRDELRSQWPEEREVAFDPDLKMMATIHNTKDGYWVAVKGAPEAVLERCTDHWTAQGAQVLDGESRDRWQQRMHATAEAGLRVLAFATKTVDAAEADPYGDLTLLGVVGLEDPPRPDIKDSIKACHQAGIRVVMVTGDQQITARNIGLAVGLVGDREAQALPGKALIPLDDLTDQRRQELQQVSIFARVSPEQKLNLIALHQADGAIVAMTGDGVNDAPALQKADIGVAMGQRGTQVAQEAADMVLQDDSFASIVAAVAQGRAIFRNIRQFTLYLLSGNTGEIIAVALASFVNAPLPLLPLQILYINAVNDVFPALALGLGEGDETMMQRPPRKGSEAVLTQDHWIAIGLYGLLIAATTLGTFAIALLVWQLDGTEAVTISFMTLAFSRLWHIFNMRSRGTNPLRNEVTRNPFVWGALVICTLILLAAVYVPGLSDALGTTGLSGRSWGLVFGASLIPLIVGQLGKVLFERKAKR